MVVVLFGRFIPLPRAAAEAAKPVVGRTAIGRRISPHIPITLGAGARRSAIGEPRVFIRSVVGDEIEEESDVAGVQYLYQPVKIFETAKNRIDGTIVGDVIAKIQHRRR